MAKVPKCFGVEWSAGALEILALDEESRELFHKRVEAPQNDYEGCLSALSDLFQTAQKALGSAQADSPRIGLTIPGSLSPTSGLIVNSRETKLDGRPLTGDVETALSCPVRIGSTATCLAISEAYDGAATGLDLVQAIYIGSGSSTGLAINGKSRPGPNGIAGDWGSIAQPWRREDEFPGPDGWTGHRAAIDMWCSGTGFRWDYERATGQSADAFGIVERMRQGDAPARAAYYRYVNRLGRAMAMVTNLVDPDVFVLGGPLAAIEELYKDLPSAMTPFVMSDGFHTPIRKAEHGAASALRGATRLWSD